MEVSSPRVRPVLGIVMYLPWALGTMAWGGAAYLLRSWRWLQLSVSLLFLLFLPALLLLDESPRWLAVRGYHSHALAVLQRAARWNGVHLPPRHRLLQVIRDSQIEETASSSSASRGVGPCSGQPEAVRGYFCQAFILVRTPRLRAITLGTCYNYLAVGMVYFGLSFSGEYLSSDPYLYMVLMGLVEVPAYTLMIPVVTNCGRRSTIVVFFLLSGVMLLLLPFIPEGCGWVAVCLALVGKMTITAAFQVLALYSSELFPTEVRTRGTCTAFMMSRVGSMVSPFITEYLGSARGWMPSVVFGAASLVAGAATLGLPETGGTSLPDTITQLEDRAAGQGYRKLLWAMTGDMGGGWPCRARGAPTPQVAALLHHHAHLHTQNHLPTHLSADLPTQLPTPLPTQDDLPIQPPTHLHTYSYPSTSAHLSL